MEINIIEEDYVGEYKIKLLFSDGVFSCLGFTRGKNISLSNRDGHLPKGLRYLPVLIRNPRVVIQAKHI